MRGFFTVIFFIVIFFAFPIAVFIYSINSVITADYIKNRLNEAKIYSVVAEELPEFITQNENTEKDKFIPPEAIEEFKNLLAEEVSAEYIQNKTEPFIDDTFAWLNDEKKEPPQLSLEDFGEKLQKSSMAQLLTDEANEIFSEPLKFDKEGSNQLKNNYQIFKIAPATFSIISGIALLLIVLLAKGWKSKLRRFSLALFLPTLSGLVFAVGLVGIGQVVSSLIFSLLDKPGYEIFITPASTALESIPMDISKSMFLIYGITLGLSVLLFIVSFFVSGKKESKVESVAGNSEVNPTT